MITVEELKLKFGVRNIPGRGPCIVIPKSKFNIEWEQPLRNQHVDVEYNIDLAGGGLCTVLRLKPEHLTEHVVYRPKQLVGPTTDPSVVWRPEEDQLIIELWNKRMRVKDIETQVSSKFPKRTSSSVKNRIQRLQIAGKIQRRQGKLKGKHEKPRALEAEASERATPLEPASPKPLEKKHSPDLVKLLTEIRDLLKPKDETVSFKSYCPHCRDSRHVEDVNVWKHCPVCGEPLVVWNVEVFND
jgi:hypothetical protein